MSGGGENRIAGLALKHGLEVMIFAYLIVRNNERWTIGRNLLSALAIVIRAVNGSVISSKSDRRFIGGGFDEIGSKPAKHIETI